MLANGPETLDGDTRALQIEPDKLAGDINTRRQSKSGRSDLIEWNSTNNAGQSDRTPGFLPDDLAFDIEHSARGKAAL